MYEWGTNALPVGTFDGQVHVDGRGKIRQWDMAGEVWVDKPTFSLVESWMQEIALLGESVSADIWLDPPVATVLPQVWDGVYAKALVELTWHTPAGPVQRIAEVTLAELEGYIQANGPQAAGAYTSNCLLKVFEVVSPDLTVVRMQSQNRIFGSMKGRKSYFGHYGRGDPANGTQAKAGYGTRFTDYWTNAADLIRRMINEKWSVTPATDEPRVLWFPVKKTGTYRSAIGKGNVYFALGTSVSGRRYWNLATNTYGDVGLGTMWIRDDNQAPIWVYAEEDPTPGTSLNVADLQDSAVRGSSWVWKAWSVVVAVPVQDTNDANNKAFVMVPLGITDFTVQTQDTVAGHDVVAVNEYGTSARSKYPVVVPNTQQPSPNMIRCRMFDAMHKIGDKPPGAGSRVSLDSAAIPMKLRVYVRNPATGVRGAYADRSIDKVMRKKDIPLAWNLSP
jgi:hypothetical protein